MSSTQFLPALMSVKTMVKPHNGDMDIDRVKTGNIPITAGIPPAALWWRNPLPPAPPSSPLATTSRFSLSIFFFLISKMLGNWNHTVSKLLELFFLLSIIFWRLINLLRMSIMGSFSLLSSVCMEVLPMVSLVSHRRTLVLFPGFWVFF